MDFNTSLQSFYELNTRLGGLLDGGLLVLARMLAFAHVAPILNRKDVPFQAKLALSLFLTVLIVWIVPTESQTFHGSFASGHGVGLFLLQILMNIIVGAVLGFIPRLLIETVASAGSLANNQIGLSSANVMDPTTKTQGALLGPLFTFIGTIIFIKIGGVFHLMDALMRSFDLFPLFDINPRFPERLSVDYLIYLSANIITTGLQMVGPVFVVTMTVDIMLGIVNRAAQQIPVFQLSFATKPAVGAFVLWLTIPTFIEVCRNFLMDYHQLYLAAG